MPAGDTNTVPFCGTCGWDHIAQNKNNDQFCDSCGADVTRFGFGPTNSPSVPNASAGTGQVSFSWIPAVNFSDYQFRSSIDGADYVVVGPNATSPQVVVGTVGQEICGSLRAKTDGIYSEWSADSCATVL